MRSAVVGGAAGRGGEVVEDEADDAALGDEGDHAHVAAAAGTDERIDLVDPADEMGPPAAKGGEGGGRRGRPGGCVLARLVLGGDALLSLTASLTASLPLASDDVGAGAAVVDEVAARIGDVGEETGEEVEGVEGLVLLVVVARGGQVRCGSRPRFPPEAGEAEGVAEAVAGERLEAAAVSLGYGHGVVDREAGMAPGEEEAGAHSRRGLAARCRRQSIRRA